MSCSASTLRHTAPRPSLLPLHATPPLSPLLTSLLHTPPRPLLLPSLATPPPPSACTLHRRGIGSLSCTAKEPTCTLSFHLCCRPRPPSQMHAHTTAGRSHNDHLSRPLSSRSCPCPGGGPVSCRWIAGAYSTLPLHLSPCCESRTLPQSIPPPSLASTQACRRPRTTMPRHPPTLSEVPPHARARRWTTPASMMTHPGSRQPPFPPIHPVLICSKISLPDRRRPGLIPAAHRRPSSRG